jgi:hypothetical protein
MKQVKKLTKMSDFLSNGSDEPCFEIKGVTNLRVQKSRVDKYIIIHKKDSNFSAEFTAWARQPQCDT